MRPVRAVRKPFDLKFYLVGLALVVFGLCNLLYFSPGAGVHLPRHGRLVHDLVDGGRRALISGGLGQSQSQSQQLPEPPAEELRVQPAVAALACADEGPDCEGALHRGACFNQTLIRCRKACEQCGMLRSLVQNVTTMTVEVVEQYKCEDAEPECEKLKSEGRCEMGADLLMRCKATCGFCKPPGGSSKAGSSGSSGGACQDVVDVCPYLDSSVQLCAKASYVWWVPHVCGGTCGCGTDKSVRRVTRITDMRSVASNDACEDYHEECDQWRAQGKCAANSAFMWAHCPLSCGKCRADAYTDLGRMARGRDHQGSLTVAWLQEVDPLAGQAQANAQAGAQGAVQHGPCQDQNTECGNWASKGECGRNPQYMNLNCAVACGLCNPPAPPPVARANSGPLWHFPQPLAQVMLNNGVMMPMVGYGTAGLTDGTANSVLAALQAGYRHIDSAQAREWYREELVGQGWHHTSLRREELFLTTKIHPRHLGHATTLKVFPNSLKDLNTAYVDLVLLHYPSCWGDLCSASTVGGAQVEPGATWRDTWRAFEELYVQNKTRAIGASNFGVQEMQELVQWARIKPQVLQVHMDPLAQNRQLLEFCRAHGIQMVAYSSLGTQWGTVGPDHHNPVLKHPVLLGIAQQAQRSVAQVVLRWALQLGVVVLPRSSNPDHMRQSLALWDFSLTDAQMQAICDLDGSKPQ